MIAYYEHFTRCLNGITKLKPMRLNDYDYSQDGAYFVTICTQNRPEILSDIVGDDVGIVPSNKTINAI